MITVKKDNYSWGKMVTVHHGNSHSYPLHPEHQEAIKALKHGESTEFKDETGKHVKAERDGEHIYLSHKRSGEVGGVKSAVPRHHFTESKTFFDFRKAFVAEAKDSVTRDTKTGKVTSWKHEGDWKKSPGTTTDKSGAKHTPMSKVRHLARMAGKKVVESADHSTNSLNKFRRAIQTEWIDKK